MSIVIHGINSPLPLSMYLETHLLQYKLFDYTRHDDIRSFVMGKPWSSHEQGSAPNVLLLLSCVNSLLVSRVENESVTLNVSFYEENNHTHFLLSWQYFFYQDTTFLFIACSKKDCVVLCEASIFLWLIISVFFSSWDRVLLHIQSGLELRVFCSLEC